MHVLTALKQFFKRGRVTRAKCTCNAVLHVGTSPFDVKSKRANQSSGVSFDIESLLSSHILDKLKS